MKNRMKLGLIVLASCLLLSCGVVPTEKQYFLNIESAKNIDGTKEAGSTSTATDGQVSGKGLRPPTQHTLHPEDVIDVFFQFDTLSNEIYRTAPHDLIEIKFLTASEYNDIHQVRPDGYISLPFVGDVKVSDRTTTQIKDLLTKLYQPILKEPNFYVSIKEYQVHLKQLQRSLDHPNYGRSRLLTVRSDYRVSFPLIGEIDVKSKSLREIQSIANTHYQTVNPNLKVNLFVHKTHPRYFYVMGEVNSPGSHLITRSITLFEALAMAGGASRQAKLESVLLLRRQGTQVEAKVYNLKAALKANKFGSLGVLQADDVIFLPRTKLASTANVARQVSSAMLFNGFGMGFSYRVDDKGRITTSDTNE